jgi:DNA repair exonuclease SbcCD ATPase subunit
VEDKLCLQLFNGTNIQGSLKVFGRFRRKKEVANTKDNLEMPKDGVNPKFRSDEDRDPPKYTFRRPREEEEINLTEVLSGLLQRLNSLDKQRTDLEEDIYQLGGEAEKEAEDLEKELSTLKEQTRELEEVLSAIHAHRKGVRYREPGH